MTHKLSTSFVFGYHGCDKAVAKEVLAGVPFRHESNPYDWLGHGVYFWEANPMRGLEYARELRDRPHRTRGSVREPTVIGAVIDLGLCLDLTSTSGIRVLEPVHSSFVRQCSLAGDPVPENRGGPDKLLRNLDCAVIEHLHEVNRLKDRRAIETVRGVFLEGSPIYEGSGFRRKTHIQICVREAACIKGVFRVPAEQLGFAP